MKKHLFLTLALLLLICTSAQECLAAVPVYKTVYPYNWIGGDQKAKALYKAETARILEQRALEQKTKDDSDVSLNKSDIYEQKISTY